MNKPALFFMIALLSIDLSTTPCHAQTSGVGRQQGGGQVPQGGQASNSGDVKLSSLRYTGPLFDAHSHLTQSLPPDGLILLMRKAGLARAVIFGPMIMDDSVILQLQKKNPDFVFPFAQLPRDPSTRRVMLNESGITFVRKQLDTGVMRGIGEISVRHRAFGGSSQGGDQNPADDPILLNVYDLAAERRIPVNIHMEHEYSAELERALAHNPHAVIIWAHMGDGPCSLVKSLMENHSNLFADISCRNPYFQRGNSLQEQSLTDPNGDLKSDWKSLFEEFPDRFMFGLDLGFDRYNSLDKLIEYYRSVLGQLTPGTAEKIGHKNIESLLNLRGSNSP